METVDTTFVIEKTTKSQIDKVNFNHLEFGNHLSDHMFTAVFSHGKWHDPIIKPYQNLSFSPAMLSLHYGQSVFEGLKAFMNKDGNICIFRADRHHQRMNRSLARMCMPEIPEEYFIQAIKSLVEVDKNWIPQTEGASLYIRPVMFATEARLGVKISEQYLLVILTSPVGPYFSKPLRLKVEEEYVRAAEGGTGFVKCAGNYGGVFYPTQKAKEEGFDQVIWTDARDHQYIDEAGVMNAMFIINGKLVTPVLTSSLLDGVTRDSILTLAREMGKTVEERKVSVQEVMEGISKGTLIEAFGTGTAAVVSPIAIINIHGSDYHLPPINENSFQMRVKQKLNNIRMGIEPDQHGWNIILPG